MNTLNQPFEFVDASQLSGLSPSEREPSLLTSEATIQAGQEIMTMFGLWLDEHGYGEYADRYSDPRLVQERLQRTDTSRFVIGDRLDDVAAGSDITSVPIDYFRLTAGVDYSDATDGDKDVYRRREASLRESFGELATLATQAQMPTADAKGLRKQAVEHINQYASHDDGRKEVVDGRHFSTSTTNTFAKRPDAYWLGRLLAADDQARHDLVDEVSDDNKLFRAGKTTVADVFLHDMLTGRDDENQREIQAALADVEGYLAAAQLLFAGNMLKAYLNISAVATMTNQPMPEGWQAFHGSTADFATIRDVLDAAQAGLDGYLAIADEQFAGNMKKAYLNISAVATMTNQPMPEGWQAFQGSTSDFATIREALVTAQSGLDGYLALADEQFAGNMTKAYQNISAVATMTNQPMPEGWQEFQGSTSDFARICEALSTAQSGLGGYLAIADEQFAGNMLKAYLNISAVATMTNQPMPEGWQAFQGSTSDFATIREALVTAQAGLDGYLTLADEQFAGDMQKAYVNISAVATMTNQPMPEGWQQFSGSTSEFRKQVEWLRLRGDASYDAYKTEYYQDEKPKKSGDTRVKSKLNFAIIERYIREQQSVVSGS